MGSDFKEILGAEIISITGGLMAGGLLAFFLTRLEAIPAMFVLLPGFFEMKGSIGGSLTARLSSALHKGTLKSRFRNKKVLFREFFTSFSLMVTISICLGFITFLWSYFVINVYNPKVILIPVIAVLLSSFFEIAMFIYTTIWLYSHGHDPDNIMGPYVTTMGDITSVTSLVIAVMILG